MLMNTHESRLAALRKELMARSLDGFVIPISDEHMSEYVGTYAQRLAWLTGFGGSAGTAIVLTDAARTPAAAMLVDGRYTLQVRDQVDGRFYTYENVPQTSVAKWLAANAPQGARIGYDPWLHGKRWVTDVTKALEGIGGALVAVESNPVDAVWQDRPAPSPAPLLVHELCHAGVSSETKRTEAAQWLTEHKLDAAVITALDSIAWLLNVRGSDVERTPVALSFLVLHADGSADLYAAPEKLNAEVRAHLGNAVRSHDRAGFVPALHQLAGKRVAVDPERAVQAVFSALTEAGADVRELRDPAVLPKAVKNPVEQQGHRDAQARDGAAMARFLRWLSLEARDSAVNELQAAERLHQFRRETPLAGEGDLRDLSFDTISGSGPNGAIVHYRVSEETNRPLEPNSVFLVDSGGQYPDGTTDITRTVWIGPDEAPAEVRDRFTRVLKGHIALARAVFPKGTVGSQLDALARQFLWSAGLDYQHGTGHGVGSFLSVHEGPQRIAKSGGAQGGTEQELLAGMIVSNEPGYYKAGEYGIRIENLILVEPRIVEGGEDDFLGFDTLTLVPIDRALIEPGLLSDEERGWLDAYHARVAEVIAPRLEGEERDWLLACCARLAISAR
jgi:Xaa-Pro aminopeptidase